MPPVLRPRGQQKQDPDLYHNAPDPIRCDDIGDEGNKPPTYTIDLSQAPSERYQHLVSDFKPAVSELVGLFDEVCEVIKPRIIPIWLVHLLAWVFLRRLYDTEQTRELRGLSRAFGVPLYLLIAYNILLDLLMGCTSGGMLVEDSAIREASMMHFRTLDWGMPTLRKATVQLNFKERSEGPIIATTVGYVGFVGVLTGVRPNLSMSLNFRPYRNASQSSFATAKYHWHLLLVLLGFRPSISAVLRELLLPSSLPCHKEHKSITGGHFSSPGLSGIDSYVKQIRSATAYLIFCTGKETMVIEKDFESVNTRRSETFVTATNHDHDQEALSSPIKRDIASAQHDQYFLGIGMQDLIEESMERKQCITDKWENHVRKERRRIRHAKAATKIPADYNARENEHENEIRGVKIADLRKWILQYPVCNDDTHFACIMHPIEGTVFWVRSFEEGEIETPDT